VWRQTSAEAKGGFVRYEANDVSPDMSFLEMLDVVNEQLSAKGEAPIAFDHDCREGICGACGMMINGVAHGPSRGTATCTCGCFATGRRCGSSPGGRARFR
jgi:succinate dehydrogenase / fumarate reductase iron-sulfur subunit